jgi:hypothetical protein
MTTIIEPLSLPDNLTSYSQGPAMENDTIQPPDIQVELDDLHIQTTVHETLGLGNTDSDVDIMVDFTGDGGDGGEGGGNEEQ